MMGPWTPRPTTWWGCSQGKAAITGRRSSGTGWSYGRFHADLATWPDDERRATEEALHAALIDALERLPAEDIAAMLGGLASVYDDIEPWLARVDAVTTVAARGGVARLALLWAFDLATGYDRSRVGDVHGRRHYAGDEG